MLWVYLDIGTIVKRLASGRILNSGCHRSCYYIKGPPRCPNRIRFRYNFVYVCNACFIDDAFTVALPDAILFTELSKVKNGPKRLLFFDPGPAFGMRSSYIDEARCEGEGRHGENWELVSIRQRKRGDHNFGRGKLFIFIRNLKRVVFSCKMRTENP
jgi:hypothetical protein